MLIVKVGSDLEILGSVFIRRFVANDGPAGAIGSLDEL